MFDKLRARYERRNHLALIAMALADVVCWFVARTFPIALRKQPPLGFKKILLVNPAHIGDVVISTAAIRCLKESNDEISIGVVVGSWAKSVLEEHPGVDRVFIVDHWRLNRSDASNMKKIWRYFCTWWKACGLLSSEGYDAGVLLNSFSPNLSALLWFSRIPVRVGYVSSGMSPLLNVVLPKPGSIQPERIVQLKLLQRLGFYGASPMWVSAPKIDVEKKSRHSKITLPFVVLHPGTGNPAKSWPRERWVELAEYLNELGWQVVLTGHGSAEYQLASAIGIQTKCVNLVNALSWDEWIATLLDATVIIGVDSAVGHICESLQRPFVGIYSGIGAVARWAPQGDNVSILTRAMTCSPCHTRPCQSRPCIISVQASDVGAAVSRFL